MARHMQEYVNYVTRKFPEVLTEPVSWEAVG
jgi:hypothetical protein